MADSLLLATDSSPPKSDSVYLAVDSSQMPAIQSSPPLTHPHPLTAHSLLLTHYSLLLTHNRQLLTHHSLLLIDHRLLVILPIGPEHIHLIIIMYDSHHGRQVCLSSLSCFSPCLSHHRSLLIIHCQLLPLHHAWLPEYSPIVLSLIHPSPHN